MKYLRKNLKRNIKILRKAYRKYLNSSETSGVSLWLTDNFHIIEKNYSFAVKETKKVKLRSRDSRAFELCSEICKDGILPDDSKIISCLLSENITAPELEHLRLFTVCVLISSASKYLRTDEEKAVNSIKSLMRITETNFSNILFEVSETEKILSQDPAGVYKNMDEATKNIYRSSVYKKAEKTGETETSVAVAALEKAKSENRHIGFFLDFEKPKRKTGAFLIFLEALIPLIAGLFLSVLLRKWYILPLTYLPLWEGLKFISDVAASSLLKNSPLPKMEFPNGIPQEEKTVIAVSTLLPSAQNAKNIVSHLKDLCLSNCKNNACICLLADLKSAQTPTASSDRTDIKAMKRVIQQLNDKYGNKFILAVRPRTYSKTENEYTGAERKRGAITSLIKFITENGNDFLCVFGDEKKLIGAKHIMALDSDTQMPLGSLESLVATAAHPLNAPVISISEQRVISGYGIISPKVETSVESAAKTRFSSVMAGTGGLPAYSSAAGEKYQDFFGESIFSGKGLIDVRAFAKLLPDRFPEQRVLSHDILEGIILRTGFSGSAALTDSFPSNETSYFKRLHRWIRGDVQNLPTVFKKSNSLPSGKIPALGKWWLIDNVRRAATPVFALISVITALFTEPYPSLVLALAAIMSAVMPELFSCAATLVRGGVSMISRLYFSDAAPYALTCLLRAFANGVMLCENAFYSLDAFARSSFRLIFTKKHLLQWTTAADSEKNGKKLSSLKISFLSALSGVILIIFGGNAVKCVGILFILDLPFSYFSSKKRVFRRPSLTEDERNTLISYCASMWRFYEKYCTKADNYLIPDNVQETPIYRVAHRTSPTNIGLMLCAFLAARDFEFIDTGELFTLLSRSFDTVMKLEKYRGNLYNWYNTQTLEVMRPSFVSTVDSGNFLCCLASLKEGLKEYINERPELSSITEKCEKLISECDLGFLFDKTRNLFRIGFDTEKEEMTNSYFDLLMSEARMTSYFAVSSGKVPVRHWEVLGRTLSKSGRYTGPVSWSGTMFEYFMPAIFLPAVRNTLGGEALKFCIHCQKKSISASVPYGVSESGFYAFDSDLNYQYKAHGVCALSLRNAKYNETVISPYSSFLTVSEDPHGSMNNLKRLDKLGMYGQFGFYEAADFTKNRTDGQDFSVVRSYMAHHVGMSFLAAANGIFSDIMQKRFMSDDAMTGGKSLLYEKIPSDARVYKNIERSNAPERPERIPKIKSEFENISLISPHSKVLTNGEWSFIASDSGASVSVYRNSSVFFRHFSPLTYPDGVFAAVKYRDGINKILPFTLLPIMDGNGKFFCSFTENSVSFKNRDSALSCSQTVTVHPRLPAQLHTFTIRNKTKSKKNLSLMIYAEPMLGSVNTVSSHPAFQKLFISENYNDNEKALTFTRASECRDEQLYIAAGFLNKSDFDYSADREYVIPRDKGISGVFSKNYDTKTKSVDKCMAIQKKISLPAHSSVTLTFIICGASSEAEALNRLAGIRKEGAIAPSKCAVSPFDPSSITGIYAAKILERSLFGRQKPKKVLEAAKVNNGSRDDLWALGISGDFPITLIEITDYDLTYVPVFIKLHSRLRNIGIMTETVFITDRTDGYNDKLKEAILAEGGAVYADLINKRSGVFILNSHDISEKGLGVLLAGAVAVYPESRQNDNGGAFAYKPILSAAEIPVKAANGFVKNGYIIGKKPEVPWSHIICNRNFGTLITDSSLGYTWALNSRENKLTPWSNDTRTDLNGEKLILTVDGNRYDVIKNSTAFFSDGRGEYCSSVGDIKIRTSVTVPGENMCKVISAELENESEYDKELKLSYYIEPVLGDFPSNGGYIKKGVISSGAYAHTPYNKTFTGYLLINSDEKCDFSFDKISFLSDKQSVGDSSDCIIAVRTVKLPGKSGTKVKFCLSYASTVKAAEKMPYIVPKKKAENKIEIETPDKELNRLFNDFLPNQIIGGRIFARTGFYQCSGAFGFRDQLQDAMSVVLTNPEILKVQIFRCAAAQFTEGDVLHWFHQLYFGGRRVLRGVRTHYSDDLLWLPLAVSEYCIKTGDLSVLKTPIPYIEAPVLEKGEKERFGEYTASDKKGTLYVHCLKAIKHACEFGEHRLPLIKGGDWNDSFNKVGNDGRGESVWLAMFLSHTVKNFSVLCGLNNDRANCERLMMLSDALQKAVDTSAWDENHYLRCFYDDGTPMGKTGNSECAIDLLPQSWSVISGMPDKNRCKTAVKTAYEKLVDKEHNIIKLFAPAFTPDGKTAGYVNIYPEGIRENAGQYTHGAVWLADAFFRLNEPDTGYELLNILNPAKKDVSVYKTEPYYLSGDVYANPGQEGRGGWSIYSGSAGWFYRTVYERMLGIRQAGGKIKINPCLPIGFRDSRVKIITEKGNMEFIL